MIGVMRAARRLVGFVLVMVTALALAACTSGSATPNLSPVSSGPAGSAPDRSVSSRSVSATATASLGYPADVPLTGHNVKPGEKPPVYPAAANTRTQAGANAFAEFFMRTLDWAYATTNPSYMKHYFGPTCGLCSGIATGITKTASERHWYEGGRITVRSIADATIAPVTAPADYCSSITVSVTAQTVIDQSGKVFNGAGANSDLGWKLCSEFRREARVITYFAASS
jgi:hypothetical protein